MIARIIITLLIIFLGGLSIGMWWGLYIEQREHYMKLSKIKIKESFQNTPPDDWNMKFKWRYYRQNGKFYSPIVVNGKGYLVDGYTSYLIAKAEGLKEVEVVKR